jgi:LAS superfamily LD-carboxypeptidase LdcB
VGYPDKNLFSDFPFIHDEEEDFTTPIDLQNETLGGSLYQMVFKHHVQSVPLNNIQEAVIMCVNHNPIYFDSSHKLENEIRNNIIPKRYKVKLLNSRDNLCPLPDTLASMAIFQGPDYTANQEMENGLSVGSRVVVNITTRTVEKVLDTKVIFSMSNAPSSSYSFQNLYKAAVKKDGPISLDMPKGDIKFAFAHGLLKGEPVKKPITLKPVVSYSAQYLEAEAADHFNELCKAAAEEGVKVVCTSGYREQEAQVKIYNERWVKPYPTKPNENSLSTIGKDRGTAAYPGTSNHQAGIAADIDVGPHINENRYLGAMMQHPAYIWMFQNAEKYGFDNKEGRRINEPWHWVYKNSPITSQKEAEERADGSTGGQPK